MKKLVQFREFIRSKLDESGDKPLTLASLLILIEDFTWKEAKKKKDKQSSNFEPYSLRKYNKP